MTYQYFISPMKNVTTAIAANKKNNEIKHTLELTCAKHITLLQISISSSLGDKEITPNHESKKISAGARISRPYENTNHHPS